MAVNTTTNSGWEVAGGTKRISKPVNKLDINKSSTMTTNSDSKIPRIEQMRNHFKLCFLLF
jgi:hypothetical protein